MLFIGNRNLIESLNRKVVERKVDSIANTIIHTMEDKIDKLASLKYDLYIHFFKQKF